MPTSNKTENKSTFIHLTTVFRSRVLDIFVKEEFLRLWDCYVGLRVLFYFKGLNTATEYIKVT